MKQDNAGRIIEKQLLRSGMSIGANIHEAQGGQSKADFISKMSIAHKEAYETAYWLKIIGEAQLAPAEQLLSIEKETNEITRILSSILITMKNKPAGNP